MSPAAMPVWHSEDFTPQGADAAQLLAALIAARDVLRGVLLEPDRENSLHAEWRRAMAAVDAAIAKATGGAA